jgi:hypothetical protein
MNLDNNQQIILSANQHVVQTSPLQASSNIRLDEATANTYFSGNHIINELRSNTKIRTSMPISLTGPKKDGNVDVTPQHGGVMISRSLDSKPNSGLNLYLTPGPPNHVAQSYYGQPGSYQVST